MLKGESFLTQRNILSSLRSIDIQRLVLNQLIILCYGKHFDAMAAFYLNRNDYYMAYQWADKSWFSGSIPSSHIKFSACLGPAFIKCPKNDSLTFELAQCK